MRFSNSEHSSLSALQVELEALALLLCGFSVLIDEAVQNCRMRADTEFAIAVVVRYLNVFTPFSIRLAESAVIFELMQSVAENVFYTIEAELLNNALGAIRFKVQAVEALPDSVLDGLFAAYVLIYALAPERNLIVRPGILAGRSVKRNVICH